MAKITEADVAQIIPKTTKRGGTAPPGVSVEGFTVEFTHDNIHVREVRMVTDLHEDDPLRQALLTPGVPNPLLGHAHSAFWGLPCTKSRATLPKGMQHSAEVVSEYSYPEGQGIWYAVPPNDIGEPDIEVSTTLANVQTNLHWNKAGQRVPIVLSQEFTIDVPDQPSFEELVSISPVVDTQVPMTSFIYRRKENWTRRSGINVGQTVGDRARLYVGTLNKTSIFGDPVHSWLCTKIIGVRDLQRSIFVADVVYEFQFNPDTWLVPVSILDENGYPRTDANYVPRSLWPAGVPGDPESGGIPAGTGATEVRTLRQMDFFDLELQL